jgi:hypothetical protein
MADPGISGSFSDNCGTFDRTGLGHQELAIAAR